MNRSTRPRRDKDALASLRAMAAPGFEPRLIPAPTCPTGKRRWPTEHSADRALLAVRTQRQRRGRGRHLGSLEERSYACDECAGYHLTSWSLDDRRRYDEGLGATG